MNGRIDTLLNGILDDLCIILRISMESDIANRFLLGDHLYYYSLTLVLLPAPALLQLALPPLPSPHRLLPPPFHIPPHPLIIEPQFPFRQISAILTCFIIYTVPIGGNRFGQREEGDFSMRLLVGAFGFGCVKGVGLIRVPVGREVDVLVFGRAGKGFVVGVTVSAG